MVKGKRIVEHRNEMSHKVCKLIKSPSSEEQCQGIGFWFASGHLFEKGKKTKMKKKYSDD